MTELISATLARDFFERAHAVHVFRLSPDGTVEQCNRAAVENLGLPREEIVGRRLCRFLTESDAHRLEAELQVPGRRSHSVLFNFSDAEHLPYTLECWLDVQPGCGAIIVAEPPLKEDQRLQRQLMRVNQDLAVLSRERARLVEAETRARLQAETADREKDHAIATIAHELRQPLAAMRFALELLGRDAAAPVRERALRGLDRHVLQLKRLVEDLLDAARVREHKLQLHRARIDLRAVLGEVIDDVRARAAAAGVDFLPVVPETPVPVHVDSARIRQVFSNLLDNALKYTERSGRITLSASLERATASVTVRDTGRGISPEALPRVFQLFGQAGTGERGGLGIGLAVASGIVAMHGGTIEARSAGIGLGSEFVVRLPLADNRQASGIPEQIASES